MAGDPMSEQKWIRSSLRHLSQKLKEGGHQVSPLTLGRILGQLGYSLRLNLRKREAGSAHPQRNEQFKYIESLKHKFREACFVGR
jgi:hypothetical protein